MINKILIIGASGHAKVIIDIIEKEGKYEIFGLIDSFKNKGDSIFNYKILGTEKDLPKLFKDHDDIVGGIVAIGDNYTRMKIYLDISSKIKNFNFINAIHPSSVVCRNVTIEKGSVIMPGAVISSDVKIGKQCIVNTNSTVNHDCIIEDFVSIAPGATLAGGVKVGKCTAISLGANVLEMINIGKHTIIGAGSLVNKNIGSYKKAYGLPAKEISDRKIDDKYLGMSEIKNTSKYDLSFYSLKTSKDIAAYRDILSAFENHNMFYTLAYCNYQTSSQLNYFILKKDDIPQVLLPIYLNKIESDIFDENDTFYDVNSPYGYSGPLFNKNTTEEDIIEFWNVVDDWYQKNNVVTEFIRFNLENNHRCYSGHLIPTLDNVRGKLSNFDSIWDNFKQKVRNNYRKAVKSNLSIEIHTQTKSSEVIDQFYDIYISTMKRNNATENYFYSKDYFTKLINENFENTIIAIVFKENIAISTELILINKSTIYSYLGGTNSDYFNYRPNDYLKIEMIKWALENNKNHYVLGGGRSNGDGLYQYKKSFFPKDKDVLYYTGRKVINPEVYNNLIKEIKVEFTDVLDYVKDSKKYFPIYSQKNTCKKNESNNIKVIFTKNEWKTAIKNIGYYDFYHTYDYHNLSKLEGETPLLIEYKEENKVIYLPLIKREIPGTDYFDATSVYGYAGPLQKSIDKHFNNINFLKALNSFFEEEKIVSVFSRLNPFIDHQETILKNAGTIEALSYIVNIDLTKDIDEQRTIFSKTTKRYINKCRKTFNFKISDKEEDILMFIDLYYENMDRVNAEKKYYFSKQYFLDFINSEDFETDVLLAIDKENEEIISAAMMVKTNNIIQYHISGTRNDYLNISPIRLLIDEMRLKGTKEGYKYFNLGGGLGNQEDELFRFKASFSKDFKPFKTWKHIANENVYKELIKKNEVGDLESNFFPLYRLKQNN